MPNFPESVRRRPGAYIGDLNWQGALRCLGMAVDVMCSITSSDLEQEYRNGRHQGLFRDHALLNVQGSHDQFALHLFYSQNERDFLRGRLRNICQRNNVSEKNQYYDDVQILRALADAYSIENEDDKTSTSIICAGRTETLRSEFAAKKHDDCSRHRLTTRIKLPDMIDVEYLSQDILRGYLFSKSADWMGLILEEVNYQACGTR